MAFKRSRWIKGKATEHGHFWDNRKPAVFYFAADKNNMVANVSEKKITFSKEALGKASQDLKQQLAHALEN